MTSTDGAGAVPAGGGSSLPLPGDPGIDPAGIMTGARGASLKRDAKAKVTPAHCIARSAARIEPRHMAEASAAVERRKASALRSARGRAPQSTDDWCAFSALRLPLFFWRQKIGGFGRQNPDADCVAGTICFTLPCRGRVAHRWCAGWGARLRRESQRARARFHPIPPPFGRRPSPSRGRCRFCRVTSSASAWRCRSGFLLCLRRTAARCASTPAPAGS